MERHSTSFQRKGAAYNILLADSWGMEPFPADVTGFDIAHAALRHAIHFGFNSIAIITLASQWENINRRS